MIIKAIFVIGAMWLFMPHEPNVGYGHPASLAPSASVVSNLACKALGMVRLPCNPVADQASAEQTSAAPDTIDRTRESFLERLQDVKADLRAARR